MDVDVLTLIAQNGGMAGLAIFAIWMLNRTWKERVDAAERYAADLRRVQEEVRKALDRNTRAWSRLGEWMGVGDCEIKGLKDG